MKKCLLGSVLWCELGVAVALAAVPPADVVVSRAEEVQAFNVGDALVFDGQTLKVLTSFSTERDIWLESQANIEVGSGVRFELAGEVAARAQSNVKLHKWGPGTLRVAGENGYHGITLLREGVLNVARGAALGDHFYVVEQFAGTELQMDDGASLQNFIQIRPSTLEQALPGLDGVAQWRVDKGTAVFQREVNSRVPIRKVGAGTLRLQDMVMGSPELLVQQGALAIDSSTDARVTVATGARVEGSGELGRLSVLEGGVAAPGSRDAVGSMIVWGDARFASDSTYHVNAHADGRADMLWVGGVATLDGRVQAQAADGDWADESRYRILRAEGGLGDSRFSQVETDLAFLDPALEYDANTVYLSLRRNDKQPGDLGETPEEQDVGDAITPPSRPRNPPTRPPQPPNPETPKPDPKPDPDPKPQPESKPAVSPNPPPATQTVTPSPLQDAIEGMSVTQVRSLLHQSRGDWHVSLRSFMLEDGRHVRQAVLDNGRDGWFQQAQVAGGWRSWGQAYASTGSRSAASGVQADRHHSRGLVLGLESTEGWRPGLVLAAQSAHLKRQQGEASARTRNLHIGLSARKELDAMQITAAVLRTWHRIDSQRRVLAGAVRESHRADFTGRSWQMMFEIVPALHRWLRPSVSSQHDPDSSANPAPGLLRHLRPYLRHEWMRLKLPAYQEGEGLSAHGVLPSRTHMHASTLGLRFGQGKPDATTPSWWEADLGWRHVWGDGRVHSTQYFLNGEGGAAAGRRFSSEGRPLSRDAFRLSLEAGVAPGRDSRMALRYAGLYGGGYRDHTAWLDVRWTF